MPNSHWRQPPSADDRQAEEGLRTLKAPQAFRLLQDDAQAVLVDVRSCAEWDFVGVPLVDNYVQVEWRMYPDMAVNPDFLAEVAAAGLTPQTPLVLLCRSGQRSREAGMFLLENGFSAVYNVVDGFEGTHNDYGHRRSVNGWVAAGLPWLQC